MGVIVEATHLQLGTVVAVKILRPDYADKAEVAERFLREARAAAQLRGEHICRVHDYGSMDDGTPFMVMELLEGCDLGTWVDQEGALAPALVANYIVQVCTAIAEPHARGMVHRDLKPTNLFLEQRDDHAPFIKILDFGIAKFDSVDSKLTSTSSVVGSPSYMAPEQLRSNTVIDARTDIWALGVVMYELLTENQPFVGESMTDLALAITMEPPLPFATQVPDGLADIVLRCLEKDPARRYQNVAELAQALAPFAQLDAGYTAVSARVPVQPRSAMSVVDELIADQAKHTTLHGASGVIMPRAVPRARLGIGIVVVAAAIAIAVLYIRGSHDPGQSNKSTTDPALRPATALHAPAAPVLPADAAEPASAVAPTDAAEPAETTAPIDAVPDATKAATPTEHRRKKRTRDMPDLGNSRL